jgi:multiple sugar transport system permease protein
MIGRTASRAMIWGALFVGGVLCILPIWLMLSTSLKFSNEAYDLSLIPNNPTFGNYIKIMTEGRFPLWLLNSLIVALGTTVSVLFFDSLVGYTLAKFKFRGQQVVFVLILSTLMIPTEMLVIPWYVMAKTFGWLDSYWGIMFPGMMTGFGTFLMKQFFETVPDELLDAARIDGLSEFAIFRRIALPLVKPALAALAIFIFLGNWAAFLWPLIVTNSKDLYTLPIGLAFFSGEHQAEWEMIMAGAAIASLPTLIAFLLFQRHIIQGITLSGLKS